MTRNTVSFSWRRWPAVPGAMAAAAALALTPAAPAQFSGLSFSPATTLPSPSLPSAVTAGDVNEDGETDLIVAGQTGFVMLLGLGHATFAAPVSLFGASCYGQAIALADMNEDGHLDVVGADCSGVFVRLGAGDGTFGDRLAVVLPRIGSTYVIPVDLNGDGHLDLAVQTQWAAPPDGAPGTTTTAVLLGDGAGGATLAQLLPTPRSGYHMACGDVDGDGDVDLVAAGTNTHGVPPMSGSVVSIALNNGAGVFTQAPLLQIALLPAPEDRAPAATGVAIADFDGNGAEDIAVALIEGTDLGIAPSSVRLIRHVTGGGFAEAAVIRSQRVAWHMATADLNGDGLPDLIVSAALGVGGVAGVGGGGVEVLRNMGDGVHFAGPSLAIPAGHARFTVVADIDHHGGLDLVNVDFDRARTLVSLNFSPDGGALFPDLDGDMIVAGRDIGIQLACWSVRYPLGDINGDTSIDSRDLAIMLASYGMRADTPAWYDPAAARTAAPAPAPGAGRSHDLLAESADIDGDGVVSPGELVQALAGMASSAR